jgi:hypothetical protein
MYPVDLMKVRSHDCTSGKVPMLISVVTDTHADHQSYFRRTVYRHLERCFHNLSIRGPPDVMAWGELRHRWRR